MKELDYLKDMLCKELSKITQQSDFTTSTLETSFKIVDMLKDIEEDYPNNIKIGKEN